MGCLIGLQSKCWPEKQASKGSPGARRAFSKMVPSHGPWRKATVPHHGSLPKGLTECPHPIVEAKVETTVPFMAWPTIPNHDLHCSLFVTWTSCELLREEATQGHECRDVGIVRATLKAGYCSHIDRTRKGNFFTLSLTLMGGYLQTES